MCLDNDHVDLNNSYGFVLINFLNKHRKRFNNALKEYSIVMNHYRVLVTVYNNKYISQKKLGEILKIDRTTIVRLIDHLENENYIERQKNQEDRRSFQLILTNKGNSIIHPICKIRDEIQNQSLKEANENEKRIFREICEKIEST